MKLKTISQLCKKRKSYILYDKPINKGGIIQWLGNYGAAYRLDGMPVLDEESLCKMFDISEKQREKMIIQRMEAPKGLCMDDTDPSEAGVEKMAPNISYNGKELLPIITSEGAIFIQKQYLSPFKDEGDMIELYARKTGEGQAYIAVKTGLLIRAIIFPVEVVDSQFINQINDLVRECRRVVKRPGPEEDPFQLSWEEEEPGAIRHDP